MTNSTFTDLELKLMDNIARCLMNPVNGGRPSNHFDVNTYVWATERAEELGISEKALGGVMTSLQNKGFVWVCIEDDPEESGIGFTEAGYAAWDAATEWK